MISFLIITGCVLGFILLWLLFAPFTMEADTRVPYLRFRWMGIGSAEIRYEDDWRLQWRLFFFGKSMKLGDMKSKGPKKEKPRKQVKKRKRMPAGKMFRKVVRIIKTFRVEYWQWALDTGDHTLNAKLYPVNFFPGCYGHLQVNFNGMNYCSFRIRNRAWNVLRAYMSA
ncbi:MAG: hypothetical protein U0U70_08490 [Chitinophagaceae bacterium]